MSFRSPHHTKRPRTITSEVAPVGGESTDAGSSSSYSQLVNTKAILPEHRPYGITFLPRERLLAPSGSFYQPYNGAAASRSVKSLEHGLDDYDVDMDVLDLSMPRVSRKLESADDRVRKKENQFAKWADTTIPFLTRPFMNLLCETESLRKSPASLQSPRYDCQCPANTRRISVACIYFDKIVERQVCSCSAPLYLISRGLFPCAPQEPSLAVDLNMLDYVKELFVSLAPNVTAWCQATEAFLRKRNYKLRNENNLRRRFGQALHWYHTLCIQKDIAVKEAVNLARIQLGFSENENLNEDNNGIHVNRPSEYLRSKCPLCFGGKNCHNEQFKFDVIVCLDACFTQKRRNNSENSGLRMSSLPPQTVFISEDKVKSMEDFVETCRPSKKSSKLPVAESLDFTDGFEALLKVPNSVLDICGNSFQAANEKRMKANTRFFADTGLMAMLCRHDHVLWLVNMTSAGEKQHYALVLIKELFNHISMSMTVGILYDIGCQLHRSCAKWDFLGENLERIHWGISVFHAFGHQWPCQLIYHPRKAEGFGLSDGEGCERFWSSIKNLIPSTRVSGSYQRIFSIDNQVKHLEHKSFRTMGSWLKKKFTQSLEKKEIAEETLQASLLSKSFLRKQWATQVNEQTKPVSKQSAKAGQQAVEKVFDLINQKKTFLKEHDHYSNMLFSGQYQDEDLARVLDLQKKSMKKANELQKKITVQTKMLGAGGQQSLKKLANNKFLQLQMNALTLKARLRTRLIERKFELDNLEKAYRQTTSNATKLHDNIKSSVKRHEPTILNLVSKYNKLCDEMSKEIQKQAAPENAMAFSKLQKKTIFTLDVDDEIWQQNTLQGDDAPSPAWLSDENTRTAIKALLDLDHCLEEEKRLSLEKSALHSWFKEEWSCVNLALEINARDLDMTYQLQIYKTDLCALYAEWQSDIRGIKFFSEPSEPWGPSDKELLNALKEKQKASWDVEERDDGDGDDTYFGQSNDSDDGDFSNTENLLDWGGEDIEEDDDYEEEGDSDFIMQFDDIFEVDSLLRKRDREE